MNTAEVLGVLIVVLAIVGAFAVTAAVVWLIVGLRTSWSSRPTRVARMVFVVLAIACAALGATVAWVSS